MAKNIRALLLPNFSSILINLIAQVVAYPAGVGLLNERGKMIGWIEITAEDEALRNDHFLKVLQLINELINDPRRAVQPDFAFLTEG